MNNTRVEHSLNGTWRLLLDPEDVGVAKGWFRGVDVAGALSVTVPSVWDLWVPDYDGAGWYFREFTLDESWRGRHIAIEFEAADYFAQVWLNGTELGAHEGGYTPFALDATAAVSLEKPNLLAVRIVDPHGADGFGAFKPAQIPCAKESLYYSFAGLWGDVKLVGRSPAHLTDIFVQPDIRRRRVTVEVATSLPGIVHLRIDGTACAVEGPPGRLVLEFPDHAFWAPETPTLYTLRGELRVGDALVDATAVRFGMREFTVKDQRFHLNNRPCAVKGVLHQPDYPRTLAAPCSLEQARHELELAKQAGFNLVRMHIKTPPRLLLDLADELGLMVYEEPPIGWIQYSSAMRERCEREVREMILRDRNHASVVMWGLLNESGNAGCVPNGGAQRIKDDLVRLARSLDPTRLILDDSGGTNITRESARFMKPYHEAFEAYDDFHVYQRAPVDHDIERYLRLNGDPARLGFLSEFGFGGMEDLADVLKQYEAPAGETEMPGAASPAHPPKDARFLARMLEAAKQGYVERGLDRVFGEFSAFTAATRDLQCDAARHQLDAIRSNPKWAGYCYTQLCDAGHEFCAGVLDRWRRPKPVFEMLREIQKPLRPIIQLGRLTLAPREDLQVTVSLVNEERLDVAAELSLQVVGPTNQVFWKKKRALKIPRGGKEVWAGSVSASGSPGVHRFVVRLMQGMKCLAQNSADFLVVERPKPSDIEVDVLDPRNEWKELCGRFARLGAPQAPVHIVPPLANTVRAYPEALLAHALAQVKDGAVAIVFSPPDDWNDLADRVDPAVRATNRDSVGAFLGAYHYVKLHPVFEGLPNRTLMRQPYANVVPAKTFREASDEDICGTFAAAALATGPEACDPAACWGSDILVRRYGTGRLVFTHLRLFENLGRDPVAERLFVNLINHFARRALPSKEPLPLAQQAIEWMQRERAERVRMWMLIGMFPNWGEQGHATAYPPEQGIDFNATYPGWYEALRWKRGYSRAEDDARGAPSRHVLNLQEAFTPVYEYYPRFDYGTGYAYAEFHGERRQSAHLAIHAQDAMKVWMNGALVHESVQHLPLDTFTAHQAPVTIRQGRNTLLVKVSKIPGEFRFALDIKSATADPLVLRWWR